MASRRAEISGTAPRARAGREQHDRWSVVVAAGLVVFMAQLDTFVVVAALPAIEADLGTRTSVTEWVVLGYLVPLIALSLPAGRWLDRVGKRSALTLAAVGFATASVAAGFAPDIGWLIGARFAQGASAALLLALAPALATTAVGPRSRGRAMAVVATLGPLGAVAGPAVGGLVVQAAGWPWAFYANVPISLVVIGLGLARLPADGPLRVPHLAQAVETGVLGGAGVAVLLGLSLAASYGFGWLALTLAAVPLLAAWSRLETSRVVIDLVRAPGMAPLHLAMLGVYAAFLLVVYLAPFYLQRELHASAAAAGATLLALPAAQAAWGPVGGALADRWGARPTAMTGIGLLTVGIVLVVPLSEAWTPTGLAWRLAVIGTGLGFFLGPAQTTAMASAPRHLLGATAASVNVARQLGIALGPALATVVWAASGYVPGGTRVAVGIAAGLALLAAVALAHSNRSAAAAASSTPAGR